MVLNADKCHYIMWFGKGTEIAKFYFDGSTYINSEEENLLDIFIDNALLFDSHIKEVCEKASQKLAALFYLTRLITHICPIALNLLLMIIF